MNAHENEPQQLLTFSEVQSYLGIKSRKTLLKYIRTGLLPAFKLGGTRWRISRQNVDAFLSGQPVKEGEKAL